MLLKISNKRAPKENKKKTQSHKLSKDNQPKLVEQVHASYGSPNLRQSPITDQKQTKKKIGSDRRREVEERNKQNNAEGQCRQRGYMYAVLDDLKRTDDWRKYSIRRSWFHETCADENGVSDDVGFFCGNRAQSQLWQKHNLNAT